MQGLEIFTPDRRNNLGLEQAASGQCSVSLFQRWDGGGSQRNKGGGSISPVCPGLT